MRHTALLLALVTLAIPLGSAALNPVGEWPMDDSHTLHYNGGSGRIFSHSGLPNYPVAGDSLEFDFKPTSGSSGTYQFYFGKQDDGSSHNTYELEMRPNSGDFRIIDDEGSDNAVDSDSVSWQGGEWYHVEVDWGGSGTITATLYDEKDTQITQLSMTDTGFSSGGIGWFGGDSNEAYYDNLVLDNGDIIDDFEDNDISEYERDTGDFDVTEKQHVPDVSGKNNHGVRGTDDSSEQADPSWTSSSNCQVGSCLHFEDVTGDGEGDQFVTIRDDPSLALDNVTLAAWIYPTSFDGSHDRGILLKEQEYKMALEASGSNQGHLVGSVYCTEGGWCGDDQGGWQDSHYEIDLYEWTHVAFSYNTTHYKFYVGGTLVDTDMYDGASDGPEPIQNNPYALGIGARDPLGQVSSPRYLFRGYIDQAHVYRRTLDDGDVGGLADDDTPPSTSDNYTDDEWKETDQVIRIDCTDDVSGCAQVEWEIIDSSGTTLDSGTEGSIPAEIVANEEGNATLRYRGWDNDGNVESWNTQSIRLDFTDPVTADNYTDTGWKTTNQLIEVTCNDNLSGCHEIDWEVQDSGGTTLDSGSTESFPGRILVDEEGSLTFRYRGEDEADKFEPWNTQTVRIDTTAPTTTDNYTDTGWVNTNQTIELTCNDAGSGCTQIDWEVRDQADNTLDSGSETSNPGQMVVDEEGNLTLRYQATDQVGFTESWKLQSIKIDKDGPTTDITGPDETDWYYVDFNVTVNDTQSSLSGLAACEYRIKNGSDPWTGWQSRSCPDGGITINLPGDCSGGGQDYCQVETRVRDQAGNNDTSLAQFNIDTDPPLVTCDPRCAPAVVAAGDQIPFTPTVNDQGSNVQITVCGDRACQEIHCGFNSQQADRCTAVATDTPITKEFWIVGEDQAGNVQRVSGTYEIKGKLNDRCVANSDCISSNCESGRCSAPKLPPIVNFFPGEQQ